MFKVFAHYGSLMILLSYVTEVSIHAEVVQHPEEWQFGGAQELLGLRKRYRVIDTEWLLGLLAVTNMAEFRQWYSRTLDELCRSAELCPREPFWSTSLAVGSRQWIEGLIGDDPDVQNCVIPLNSGDSGTCRLNVTQSLYQRLMKRWQNGA